MRWVLASVDYPDKNPEIVGMPDPASWARPAEIYETGERTGRMYPIL